MTAFALPLAGALEPLTEVSPDALRIVGTGWVLRVPKFTCEEVPTADYARLPDRYRELEQETGVPVPRFTTVVAEGLVPPMAAPGPVNYMLVEWVEGEPLGPALSGGRLSPDRVEPLLAGLAGYLKRTLTSNAEYVADVCHLDQYMFGTVQRMEAPRIWLTDLEPQYQRPADRPQVFLIQVGELVKSLLQAEGFGGVPLMAARETIGGLLGRLSGFDPGAAGEFRQSLKGSGSPDYYESSWFRR